MLITRTPFRLSLYGGGLDYPEWYKENEAQVLCAGLDYYCYQTVRILPPFFKHKYRVVYSDIELTESVSDIKHPSVREVLKRYGEDRSIEITHAGDLPSRSGIGSSSAFTVGLINSMMALNGKYAGKVELAKAAIRIEQNEMQENVGFQDQCAAAFGGLVVVEANKEEIRPRRFISNKDYVNYICQNMLLGFDGKERFSGDASKIISKNIQSKECSSLMHDLSEITKKGIESFGKEADINVHAELTKEGREIKIALNGDQDNQRTKELIQATEAAGSLCTRVMGAGGGGFFVCWAPRHMHAHIKKSVKIKTWVDVKISNTGSQVIFSDD